MFDLLMKIDLLVATVVVVMTFLRRSDLGVAALVALYFIPVSLQPTFSLMKSFGMLLGFVFILKFLRDRIKTIYPGGSILYLIAFGAVAMTAIYTAKDMSASVYYIQKYIMNLILYFLIINMVDDIQGIKKIMYAICLVGLINVAIGLYSYMNIEMGGRASSLVGNPNAFGQLSGMILLIGLPFVVHNLSKSTSYKWGMILAISGTIGLIISGSRGGFLGAAIVFLFFVYTEREKFSRFVMISVIIGAVFSYMITDEIAGRYSTIKNQMQAMVTPDYDTSQLDDRSRVMLTNLAIRLWKENPVFGVGIGNYPYYTVQTGLFRTKAIAHNIYTQLLAETGTVGFLIFVLLLIHSLKNYWFVIKHRKNNKDSIYIIAQSFLLTTAFFYIVMGSSGNMIREPIYMLIAISDTFRRIVMENPATSEAPALGLNAPNV